MYCNTQATLYSFQSDGVYTRRVLDVFWDEEETVSFSTTGARSEAKVFIMIPHVDGLKINKENDRIARGVIDEAASVSELIKNHIALRITAADFKDAGSEYMWHWEVVGK